MDKTGIRISNNIGTVMNEYPSEGLQITIIKDGQETIAYVDGQLDAPGNAPAADSSASGNAAAGALLGGGSGGYAGGGVGGARPETANVMQVADIQFVPGGITRIPYPTGSQKRYRLVGVVPGIRALAF